MQSRKRLLGLESLEQRSLMAANLQPVLLVLADQQDFYYKEYGDTRASLEAAGLNVVVAATTTNPTTAHANTGQGAGSGVVIPDVALANASADDYSAIVFVGGWGSSMYQYAYNDPNFDGVTDNFYANDHYNGDATQKAHVNELINDFVAQDKFVAGICHGVTVLAWARVDGASPLAGRQVAVPVSVGNPSQFYADAWYPDMEQMGQYQQVVANGAIANSVGGQYGDPTTAADDVVVDGRIITAENYDSASYFGVVIAQQVLAAAVPPPPVATVGSDLHIHGTAEADTIYVWSGQAAGQVSAWVNGTSYGPYLLPAGGRVVVFAGDGNDKVFATDLRVSASIHGEGGHDQITGGSAADTLHGGDGVDRVWGGLGNDLIVARGVDGDYLHGREGDDVIVGGAGNDVIDGGDGRDVLIGGLGRDRINGGAGDDLLIGGTTSHDNDSAALVRIHEIWSATGNLADRVALLNGHLAWGASVFDDGSEDALIGGAGADWIFANLADALYASRDEDLVTLP